MAVWKKKWCEALSLFFLTLLSTHPLFSVDEIEDFIASSSEKANKWFDKEGEGYTVNFNNISVVEYIRFVSKIFNVNFVFEETDLQFNVTIVSEEPISAKNVMSALIQVLRSHDFSVLEQDNNLLITKSTNINQIASIVSSDLHDRHAAEAALVTRVFRIKNANLATIASVIHPMVSTNALIETSLETRQLIVTDIATNVEKIASLLLSLDAPHSPLEIETYEAKYVHPEQLVTEATQLITPFAEGNPLLLVPQKDTNTIFIVSTPYLIERTLTIMDDLDTIAERNTALVNENIFVYKAQNQDPTELQKGLHQIVRALKAQKSPPLKLVTTLQQVQVLKEAHSLLFVGDGDTINKVKDILATLDNALVGKATFLVYKIEHSSQEQIANALAQTAKNLASTPNPDQNLIDAIQTIKWIREINSLLFTGEEQSLNKLATLLPELDIIPGLTTADIAAGTGGASQFFIYTPQYLSGEEIQTSLHEIAVNLKAAGLSDLLLLHTLESMKWVPATGTLIFTGNEQTLAQVQEILKVVDGKAHATGPSTLFIYKLNHIQGDVVIKQLNDIANHLKAASAPSTTDLIQSIRTIKWVKESNSLLISGSPATNEYLKALIAEIDGKVIPGQEFANFAIYKPKHQTGPNLIAIFSDFKENLIQSGVKDPSLFDTINNLKWIERTSTLLISGDPDAVAKVEELLKTFDISGSSEDLNSIEEIENTSFLIYKLQYHAGGEIQSALKQIAVNLSSSGTGENSQNLLNAVNSVQWIKITNSLLASGQPDTLTKLKTLIENLDAPLKQVFIEVLVIETSVLNSQNIGVQWGGKMQYLTKFAGGTNNIPSANPTASSSSVPLLLPNLGAISGTRFPNAVTDIPIVPGVSPPSGFDLGVIGDIIMHKGQSFISLGSLVNALQQDNDSTVVMNPKILAQDSNNSTIFVGQNIPFNSSTVSNTGTAATVQTTNIEYRDVGVNLSITPLIGNNDIVTLDISNDISAQTQTSVNLSGTITTGLQTSHTSMNTRVHVPNKHFLVLSGMIQDSNSHFKSSIPCLGGLPLIGAAFANNDRTRAKQNIVIFVRPEVIVSAPEGDALTEHQEDVYRESAFLPSVQEAFDAAIDIVKQPLDNE
jgi:type II secretory pathway component GspD/PulD (secretin)